MGFDDDWFTTRQVKYGPAEELKELFLKKGFKRIKLATPKRNHNPTDAGHCIRKRVFQFLGAPTSNVVGFAGNMTFEMGNKLGESLVTLAQRVGIFIDAEPHIMIHEDGLDHPFSGRPDLIIDDPFFETQMGLVLDNDGNQIPVEFKTIKDKGFDDMQGYGGRTFPGVISRPKKDHVMQLTHYLKALGMPYGYIVYLNKNDQRMAFHRVWWNPMVWDDIVNEALIVEEYVRNGIVPAHGHLGHRGQIQFYARGWGDKQAGDINWNEGKFPCMWKGKDGGEGGCCDFLHLCYRQQVIEFGSDKEKAKLASTAHFKYNEGVLNVDLERLRSYAEDDPVADAPAETAAAQAPATRADRAPPS